MSALNKTLDSQHNQKVRNFHNEYQSLDSFETKLNEINKTIERYQCQTLSNLTDKEFNNYLELLDDKKHIEQHIHKISNKEHEMEYFMDTADIIFKYYDVLENGMNNETEIEPMNQNSILRFFNSSSKDESMKTKSKRNDIGGDIDRASLLDKYMQQTDNNYLKSLTNDEIDICPICESSNRTVLVNDGLCYCNDCHTIETVIIDHEKPSYKDPPREITYFSYKRINHLNEWISQIQGKESTDIPTEIYDRILLEMKKQRITNMAEITPAKVKECLKRLNCAKYYEHVPHIVNRLNGTPTISFTPDIEEKLRQMFKQIQIPFFKYAPKNRKNFLSYSYTIYKCLQLLELDEYLKYFPLLKSREKTQQMDVVWQKICEELSWEFLPSL